MNIIMMNMNMSINPLNIDKKFRVSSSNQNQYQSLYGEYKMIPKQKSLNFRYQNDYVPKSISNLPMINVYYETPIDVCSRLTNRGLQSLNILPCPAIVYPLTNEFNGSNYESGEGIVDPNILIKTNYQALLKEQNELFENEIPVVYTPIVTVLRDNFMNMLKYNNLFKFSVITLKQPIIEDLLENNEDDEQFMKSKDLMNLQKNIETCIHSAIAGKNNILLFSFFSDDFNIPFDDQILVFNYCISKYAHLFKMIGICIPKYYNIEIFQYFKDNIINPTKISKEIDNKYESLMMEMQINIISENVNENINNDNNENNNDNINNESENIDNKNNDINNEKVIINSKKKKTKKSKKNKKVRI